MKERWRCRIMGISDKFRGEDSSGLARWQRYRTTRIDKAADLMWYGNKSYVGR